MDQEYVLSCTQHQICKEPVFILQKVQELVEAVKDILEGYDNNVYTYMDQEYVLCCTQHWIFKEPVFLLQNIPEFLENVDSWRAFLINMIIIYIHIYTIIMFSALHRIDMLRTSFSLQNISEFLEAVEGILGWYQTIALVLLSTMCLESVDLQHPISEHVLEAIRYALL